MSRRTLCLLSLLSFAALLPSAPRALNPIIQTIYSTDPAPAVPLLSQPVDAALSDALKTRIKHFQRGIQSAEPTPPLELSAGDLNLLVAPVKNDIREVSEAFSYAHSLGLVTVLWAYLRNAAFKKDKDYHLAADLTGQGWRDFLGFPETRVLSPLAAGARLGSLASRYDFSLFEYWSTDYAGHKQDMPWALRQLETIDRVLAGLIRTADEEQFIVISSDHGNMEDLSTRRHTDAPVPALLLGPQRARRLFAAGLNDLTGIAPAIGRLIQTP